MIEWQSSPRAFGTVTILFSFLLFPGFSCVRFLAGTKPGAVGGIWNVCTDADMVEFLHRIAPPGVTNPTPDAVHAFLKCLRTGTKDEAAVLSCASSSGILGKAESAGQKSFLQAATTRHWAEAARTYVSAEPLSRCTSETPLDVAFRNAGSGEAALAYFYIVPGGGRTEIEFSGGSLAFLGGTPAERDRALCRGRHDLKGNKAWEPTPDDDRQCYWFDLR